MNAIDATTILAALSCALVFFGWLILPHRAASAPLAATVSGEDRVEATSAA